MPKKLTFSHADVKKYLTALGSDDKQDNLFMAIKDRQTEPKILYGPFDSLKTKLDQLNQQGWNIYILPNITGTRGKRSKADIAYVRAIWQEADDPKAPAIPNPDIVVETSKGRYHRYLTFAPCAPTFEHDKALRAIVSHWSSDPACVDISRVLRLPGYYNHKHGKPFKVKLVSSGQGGKSWDDVKDWLDQHCPDWQDYTGPQGTAALDDDHIANIVDLYKMLFQSKRDVRSYSDWLLVGMALYAETQGREAGLVLWHEWSRKDPAKYDPAVLDYKWSTFKNIRATKGFLVDPQYRDATIQVEVPEYIYRLHNDYVFARYNDFAALILDGEQAKIAYINYKRKAIHVIGKAAFRDKFSNRPSVYVFDDGKRKKVKSAFGWLRDYTDRRDYDVLSYKITDIFPRLEFPEGDELIISPPGPKYDPAALKSADPNSIHVKRILAHCKEKLCNNRMDQFNYLIGWMAHMVQHTGHKPDHCLVFRSIQGIGKSCIFTELFGRMFGDYTRTIDSFDSATGEFNSTRAKVVLLVMNEAKWKTKFDDRQGRLKTLITEARFEMNEKYLPKISAESVLRPVILGNEGWVAPVEIDDRRFVYFEVSGQVEDRQYFYDLVEISIKRHYLDFMRFLMEYDLSGFNIRAVPESAATKKQDKIMGLRGVARFISDCINNQTVTIPMYIRVHTSGQVHNKQFEYEPAGRPDSDEGWIAIADMLDYMGRDRRYGAVSTRDIVKIMRDEMGCLYRQIDLFKFQNNGAKDRRRGILWSPAKAEQWLRDKGILEFDELDDIL